MFDSFRWSCLTFILGGVEWWWLLRWWFAQVPIAIAAYWTLKLFRLL